MFVRTITSMFGRAALGQSLAKFSSKAASAVTIAALLLSGIPFQFAAAATGVTLFSDGFEGAGDFTGWTRSGGTQWKEDDNDPHTGDRHIKVKGSTDTEDDVLQKDVSTAGYENVTLSYWYQVKSGLESDDHVYVEWSTDGIAWNEVYDITDEAAGSWKMKVHAPLAIGADDSADFRIRFRADLGQGSDEVYIDDVLLVGDDIDEVAPPTPTHLSPADGSILTPAAIGTIDWTDESDPDDVSPPVTYLYQSSLSSAVNPDGSFVTPVYNSAPLVASDIFAGGTPEGVYFWHVRAVDAVGNESAWSEPWKITVSDTPATLIVEKVVVNDHGGSAVVGDFSYSLNGDDPVAFVEDGATYELSNENYSVQEVAVIGYEATFSGDCEGTLVPGETKTCTVTNDDIPAAFTLVKETIGDDDEFTLVVGDGSATASAVLATENGTATTLEPIEVSAGTYYVGEETLSEGWDYTSISCEGASGAVYESGYGAMVGVSAGDEVTCTVTNTARNARGNQVQ